MSALRTSCATAVLAACAFGQPARAQTVPVNQGGTGATSFASGLLKANGTTPFTTATPGTDYLSPSGGTLTGLLSVGSLAGGNSTAVFDVQTGGPPANGTFVHPSGAYIQYCSVAGCLPGPHLFASAVNYMTTRFDATAQETNLALNLSSVTGKATYWVANTNYAAGREIHGYKDISLYKTASACTSGTSAPNGTTSPQIDGTCSWTYIGSTINDGKSALSIAASMSPGSGHVWDLDTVLNIQAGVTAIPAFAYEMDLNNTNQNYLYGSGASSIGLFINGQSTYRMSAAIAVLNGAVAPNNAFDEGIIFDTTSRLDAFAERSNGTTGFHSLPASSHSVASFQDDSVSPDSIKVGGSHTYGLDLTGGAYSGGQIYMLRRSIAQLPACNSSSYGSVEYVEDGGAKNVTWHNIVADGGSDPYNGLVSCNGIGWLYE